MSSLDLDIDSQLIKLESEWRQAYEAGIAARTDYQSLARNKAVRASEIKQAREQLEKAEAVKARIMTKIERLEDSIIGKH